jgi:preprotein translocase subunit SecB
MMQIIYQMSSHKFNNFTNYIDKLNITHHNLPEIFLNKEKISSEKNAPSISFQMASKEIEKDVFNTIFEIKVDHSIKGFDKENNCDKEYHIFTIDLIYNAFTHINDSSSLTETEKKKILLVDVPYLIFPNIRFLIANLTEGMKSATVQINPINFAELFVKESANAENSTSQESK